jgi:lysophospholipase L1-like esterase
MTSQSEFIYGMISRFRRLFIEVGALSLVLLLFAQGAEDTAAMNPRGVHRIVFLGDSITQAGDYVVDCECWLLAHGFDVEVLNLGLGSETASDLTPAENEGHLRTYGFGRPFVSERLDRALTMTKPDLLFACYGMNDGGALPADESGLKRFAEAITRLRDAAAKAGVKRVVICAPPIYDNLGNPGNGEDEQLARFTTWLLSKRADGWDVVDLHTPMRQALDQERTKDPAFKFAKDGVHPGREGHWLMAREILTQFFGANLGGVTNAENLFPAHGKEIRGLARQRMELQFSAWMTKIGHKRPGVAGGPDAQPGPTVAEAGEKSAAIGKQISLLMGH